MINLPCHHHHRRTRSMTFVPNHLCMFSASGRLTGILFLVTWLRPAFISPWADASQQLVCRVAIARQFGFASVLVLSRLFVCYPAPSQMIKCLLVFASPRDHSHSRHSAPSLASELFRLSLQKSLTASRFPVLSALLSLSPETRRTFAQFSDNLRTIFSGRFNSSSHRLRDLFAVFIQDSRT